MKILLLGAALALAAGTVTTKVAKPAPAETAPKPALPPKADAA